MENNINTKVPTNQDEIDLRQLFDAIWNGKLISDNWHFIIEPVKITRAKKWQR